MFLSTIVIFVLSSFFLISLRGLLGVLQRTFMLHMARKAAIYPKTSKMKEVSGKAIFEGESLDKIKWNGVLLGSNGVGREIKPVVDAIRANPQDFYLSEIDFLIISRMGMEVIKIDFGEKGYDRSLFIEVSGFHQSWIYVSWMFGLFFAFTLGFAWENYDNILLFLSNNIIWS